MIQKAIPASIAAPLFGNWPETMVCSCLSGVMGEVYLDLPEDADAPVSAMAILGDFVFLAGKPSPGLLNHLMEDRRPYRILVPQPESQVLQAESQVPCPGIHDTRSIIHETHPEIHVPQKDSWQTLIARVFGQAAHPITRYATKKDPEAFSIHQLQEILKRLPASLSLHPMDEALYHRCLEESWSRDLVSLFPDWETYRKLGLGMVILEKGELVSGASSYSRYPEGIEIEIDTREDCRRRGLASVCGAALILECLKRGLYPSWDAHTLQSLSLAKKLGYEPDGPYLAYELVIPDK